MKKIQQTILTDNEIYIGLEDAKRSWKVCVRSQGMIVFEGAMSAKYGVLKGFLDNKFPQCKKQLIYEAGFHGFWLCDQLEADGISCVVTPPHSVTEQKCNKVKNDKFDARRLAKILETSDYKSCHVPSAEQRQDRQYSRLLFQVQKKIVSQKNQIRRFFEYHGIEVSEKAQWSEKAYSDLKDLELDGTLKDCLDIQLELLTALQLQRNKLRSRLKALCEKSAYKQQASLIMSFPGIGWFTAIRLILEWGDVTQFESGKKFANFLGLCPGEHSTGESVKRGAITKQGNKLCRHWLVESAWTAKKKDPVLMDKFLRVWKNSGSKNKAIVAVARKMAVRMRMVLKTGIPYELGLVEEIR